MSMRKIAAATGIVTVGILGILWYTTTRAQTPPVLPESVVVLGGQTIHVDLAQTPAEQAQGLGGRASLGDHDGMLFIFPSDGYEAFWMKDMRFSIDMLWLSADGTVVYIKSDVSPSTYPTPFSPTSPARYVLELPANFAKTYTIKVGDKAVLP